LSEINVSSALSRQEFFKRYRRSKQHMRAKDIMTTKVVAVSPRNSVRHAVQIMLDHGVSGLPVIDDGGHLVGLISEGDLLRRAELNTSTFPAQVRPGKSAEQRERTYVKNHSWSIGDVMTTVVVTIDEDMPVGGVAALMDKHGIKRVAVTRGVRLVGIVSRRDLLRAIVTAKLDDSAPGDAAIRRTILAQLGDDTGLEDAQLSVTVLNGVVHLWGVVGSESERDAARVVAEGVRGVAGITDHLGILLDAGGKTVPVESAVDTRT
jgi:CBS domain-containing protein